MGKTSAAATAVACNVNEASAGQRRAEGGAAGSPENMGHLLNRGSCCEIQTPSLGSPDRVTAEIKRPRLLAAVGTKFYVWCRYGLVVGVVLGLVAAGAVGFAIAPPPAGLAPVALAGFAGGATPDFTL